MKSVYSANNDTPSKIPFQMLIQIKLLMFTRGRYNSFISHWTHTWRNAMHSANLRDARKTKLNRNLWRWRGTPLSLLYSTNLQIKHWISVWWNSWNVIWSHGWNPSFSQKWHRISSCNALLAKQEKCDDVIGWNTQHLSLEKSVSTCTENVSVEV